MKKSQHEDAARKRRITVLVPGNPGALVFVKHFVACLRAQHVGRPEDFLVWEHPHLHTTPPTMVPYAAHHANNVLKHIEHIGLTPEEVEIDVIAYSVGAYLSYLMVAHELLPISRLFWVFPFIMRPRLAGRLELHAIATPRFYDDFLKLWRRAPERATRWLIERMGVGEHGEWIHGVLKGESARTYFVMAEAEWEIEGRRSCDYIFSHALFRDHGRFGCLLTPKDRWVPDEVLRTLAPFSYPLEGPTTHDFVLDPVACAAVVRALQRMMNWRHGGTSA